MENYMMAIATVFQPVNFFAILIGVIIGLMFGMVPGLSGVTAVGLLVPFSYGMDPMAGILMMCGVYCAATYGGSITAILFNIPGDVMAVATTFDGHAMHKKGESRRALTVAIFASCCGGLIGVIALATVAPQLAKVALIFGPSEYFALAMLGLMTISTVGSGSVVKMMKALVSVVIGILLTMVGTDPVSGATRFTFGNVILEAGIASLPAIIGIFALAEMLSICYEKKQIAYDAASLSETKKIGFLPSKKDWNETKLTILRSSVIGTIIGILPGTGATIASILGYNVDQRFSKKPEKYGTGIIRGVAAPESANNASVGGAIVPLITLGIPGSSTTAIMLAALTLHGIRPGPILFQTNIIFVNSIFVGLFIANILMVVAALALVKYLVRVLLIKSEVLSFIIITICLVGAFAVNKRMLDLWIVIFCGLIGFFIKKYGFSAGAMVLGLVLGELAEGGLIRGLSLYEGNVITMLMRPVTFVVLLISVIIAISPIIQDIRRAKRGGENIFEGISTDE